MGNCLAAQVDSASTPPNSGSSVATGTSNSSAGGGKALQKPNNAGVTESHELRLFHTQMTSPHTQELHSFTYADLRAATRNFRPDSFLGEGGFGSVFKGHIDERTYAPARPGQGLLIAVKRLNLDGLQGHKEWLAELYFLGALHHPNLVKLIGYCYEEEHRLLVYEFLSRGSLENHLFGRSHQTLPWTTRLKIAIDAARGLAFLHDAPKPVIYRDFKTSNILLDADFNAKLSDFGLAKDGPIGDKTHVTTRVMGTYGYAAPEYVATGRLTAKSDVYGFGVVLLEILTGRKAVDKGKTGVEQNLVEWAEPFLADKRRWSRVLDVKLQGQYSLKGAQKAASLALHCINQDARSRPSMKQVLDQLESILGPKDLSKLSSTSHTTNSSRPHHPRPLLSNPTLATTTTMTTDREHRARTPKQDHKKRAHNPAPDHKFIAPVEPASAFKLPSPNPSYARQANYNVSPSPSPTKILPRASP